MKRLLPFVIALFLLIGGVVGLALLMNPDSHRVEITDYLSRRLGHRVQIGKLEAAFFPPALRLQAFTLLKEGDLPLLQSELVKATLDWRSLLRAKLVPSTLAFDRWMLFTRRRVHGAWDWDEWLGPNSARGALDEWPLKRVLLRQGEWHWIDAYGGPPQELILKEVEISLDQSRQAAAATGHFTAATPLTFTFEGKGRFFSTPQWSGDLRLAEEGRQCVLHLEGKTGVIEAKGQSSEWRLDNAYALARFLTRWPGPSAEPAALAMLRDWRTRFNWTAGGMTFYHAATLDKGLMEIKGDILPAQAGSVLQLKATAQDLPLETIASVAGGSIMSGKLTGIETDFSVSFSSPSWASLEGRGSLEIQRGSFRFPFVTLKSLAKAQSLSYMRQKYPDFETRGLPFSQLKLHWQASRGMIAVDDAFLKGTGLKATLAGKLDALRHGVDAYVRIQLQEKSPDLLRRIPGQYIFGAPGQEQIRPIYGRLQGSWSEWMLRAVPSGKIPTAIQAKLHRALK